MKTLASVCAITLGGLALTACSIFGGGGSVTALDPGYRALDAGDYGKARDVFAPAQAESPHDPYLQLDLGLAYQGLGQMNMAEPLYRQVLVDGRGVIPAVTTNPADAGRDLAYIACQNLRVGLKSNSAC
jgi:hypothetical protein